MDLIAGLVVIALAYGLTWILLLKSTKVVNTIDKAGLKHPREIIDTIKNHSGKTKTS